MTVKLGTVLSLWLSSDSFYLELTLKLICPCIWEIWLSILETERSLDLLLIFAPWSGWSTPGRPEHSQLLTDSSSVIFFYLPVLSTLLFSPLLHYCYCPFLDVSNNPGLWWGEKAKYSGKMLLTEHRCPVPSTEALYVLVRLTDTSALHLLWLLIIFLQSYNC